MAKAKKPVESEIEDQNAAPPDGTGGSADSNIINVVWNFMSSMKLGIILLLILAVVSIVGTLWVPTDPMTGQPDYLKFYNNPFFNILMGLLALNLLICSLNRWKSVANTLGGPKTDISEGFVKNLKSGASAKVKQGPAQAAQKVADLLKKRGYRVFSKQDGDTYKIASDKGHLGILGPYLTHISFIVMIVAIMIKFSGLVGFEGGLTGIVGETYDLSAVEGVANIDPSRYFDMKVDNFRTEYRPDGSIQQWYSDVTVTDKTDSSSFKYSIYVNHPLIYKGIKFYQSSYGQAFKGKFSGPSAKDQPFTVLANNYIQPAGTDITFIPVGYDESTKKVAVRTYKGNNYVDEKQADLNSPVKYEQAEVTFNSAPPYTYLTVKKDPGVPVIGVGSGLLVLGMAVSFLLRQRRVWSVVIPEKDGSMVYIGGLANKDKHGLDTDLETIVKELK